MLNTDAAAYRAEWRRTLAAAAVIPAPPEVPTAEIESAIERLTALPVIHTEQLKPCLALGFDLIPLRCAEKTPRDRHWVTARYSRDALLEWIRRGGNIGVRLKSDQLVIDVDPKHADAGGRSAEWLLEDLELEFGIDLRDAPTVETGSGGYHVYLTKPPDQRASNNTELFGGSIEFKSHGRQVLAAGCKHPNGKHYRWIRNESGPIPPCPPELWEQVAKPRAEERPARSGTLSTAEIAQCLEQLDPTDFREYDEWRDLLFSVHHACGGSLEGRDIFTRWSTSDPQYANSAESIEQFWEAADDSRTDARTERSLFWCVTQAGGTVPIDLDALGEIPEEDLDSGPIARRSHRGPVARIRTAEGIEEQQVEYLWRPWLPAGSMVMLEGDPGLGKTTAIMDVSARVTTGEPFPGDPREREPGRVLILAPEDSVEHVLRPRLRVASADLRRVGFFELETEDGIALPFTMDRLDEFLAKARGFGPTLVYCDALMTVMGGKTNTHSDAAVREQLARLNHGVQSIGAQLLATRHLHKGDKSIAAYAGGGSIAFTAVARSILLFSHDPDHWEDHRRGILAHTKSNMGPLARSLRYRIAEAEQGVTRIEWLEAEPCSWTADELVTWRPDADQRSEERRKCVRFLRGHFANHVQARVGDVKAAAREQGLEAPKGTWTRARQDVGLEARGRGERAVWSWPDGIPSDARGGAPDAG